MHAAWKWIGRVVGVDSGHTYVTTICWFSVAGHPQAVKLRAVTTKSFRASSSIKRKGFLVSGKAVRASATRLAAQVVSRRWMVSRKADERAMAAQLSWSVFGTPGSTSPLGPANVEEDHADVRERAERA